MWKWLSVENSEEEEQSGKKEKWLSMGQSNYAGHRSDRVIL